MPDQDQRYYGQEVGSDQYVIHDEENDKAWIQSDYYLEVE